ncbi:MAG: DUF4430 domain-containing protein [Ruminococcus sp.]|nr:DUF4430 domain-containing protein [Ruminococcus sp.]
MKKIISVLFPVLILVMQCAGISVHAEDVSGYIQEIISYKSGGDTVQNWIDGSLSENAGITSEWYILALSQSGNYDFSSYQNALQNYLDNTEIYSASSRLKYALALASAGTDSPYIQESLENSIGQQGIMSWIYGLHLLNNGYVCESCSAEDAVNQLLSMQLEDGGWAIMGTAGDIDVTAMTVQALAVHYWANDSVHDACDRALAFLSERQLAYGGYQSFGTENLESTAQVVTALSALGIDAFSDERFIKDSATLLTGMLDFRQPDGSFGHTRDGGCNETATIQAFYTFIAYQRMQNGQGSLYLLDNIGTEELPEEETIPPEPEEPVPETVQNPENPDMPETTVIHTETAVIRTETSTSTASGTETSTSSGTETASAQTETSTSVSGTSTSGTSIHSTAMTETSALLTEIITETQHSEISEIPAISNHSDNFPLWKKTALAVILGAGILTAVIFWILKKRNWKNYLVIGILMLTASGIVLFIRIQTPEEYYHQSPVQKENAVGSVTITIRCDTLAGKFTSEYIPEDGIILDTVEIPIQEGDTVYQILTETAQAYGIQVEHGSNYYISGIQYLYEMQYGDLSGWMYRVNGELPSVGCGEYLLHDGDIIEWLYTCEIGNDLE